MLGDVFSFLIDMISSCVNFLFTLKINENPDISVGIFLLACAIIGLAIYFVLGTDFFPGHINLGSSGVKYKNNTDDYTPKHVKGNIRTYDANYSTREGRRK